MKRFWYRLYVKDVLSKTRMELPDWVFRRLIEFEAFAAERGEDGLLPPVEDMAHVLRPITAAKLSEALVALSQVGEAEKTKQGWRLTNFEARQVSESYDRVRKLREKRVVTECNDENEDETEPSLISSSSFSLDGEGSGEGKVFTAYAREIGALTPTVQDDLSAHIDEYSAPWVLAAIERAVERGIKTPAYIAGILRGFKRDGGPIPAAARGARKNDNAKILAEFERNHGVSGNV